MARQRRKRAGAAEPNGQARANGGTRGGVRGGLAARRGGARKAVDGPLDPIQEKAARDHWQAELAQQTHRIRQRELLPAADVERAWGGGGGGGRAVRASA